MIGRKTYYFWQYLKELPEEDLYFDEEHIKKFVNDTGYCRKSIYTYMNDLVKEGYVDKGNERFKGKIKKIKILKG